MTTIYLIGSTEETMDGFTPAYWNHERSEWTHIEYATIWPADVAEKNANNLPVTGVWVAVAAVPRETWLTTLPAEYARITTALQDVTRAKYSPHADLDDLDACEAELMDEAVELLHRFAEAAGIEPNPVTYGFVDDATADRVIARDEVGE